MLDTLIKQTESNIEAQQKELERLKSDQSQAEKAMLIDNNLDENAAFVYQNDQVGTHLVTIKGKWLYVEPIQIVRFDTLKTTSDE
jgi:hypothetical protein